jgi:hypothetical protein
MRKVGIMRRRDFSQLMGVLGKYAIRQGSVLPPSLDADFESILETAPVKALVQGLVDALRSPEAPSLVDMLVELYPHMDRRLRAALLTKVMARVSHLKLHSIEGSALQRATITPRAAERITADQFAHVVSEAASHEPVVVEGVGATVARRRELLSQLSPGSRALLLYSMARMQPQRDAPRAPPFVDVAEPASRPPAASRQILVTGHAPTGELLTAFEPRNLYALRFRVGAPAEENLARGEVDVTDVPETGLTAHWIVTSESVELLAVAPAGSIVKRGGTWMAEFDLAIPTKGDSAVVTLNVRPVEADAKLGLTLLVENEVYRRLTVELTAGARVRDDTVCTLPAHLHLTRPVHEWTTPPEHVEVIVLGQAARVSTICGPTDYGKTLQWVGKNTVLKNLIQRARSALEKFRVAAQAHLDDLDVADMERRLATQQWKPYDWSYLPYQPDLAHDQAFVALAAGGELRALANEGYRLFDTCFPRNSELRGIIEQLAAGSRLEIVWTANGAVDWVSHVPWALMYLDPLKSTDPVDCERFLGLRYRIGSTSWEPKAPSRALGDPAKVNALHFLYWGVDPKDEVGRESTWQRSEFGTWPRQSFVPDPNQADPKRQVVLALETPRPDPAGILYFYCHCSVKDGSDPVLQFGETAKLPDIVEASDIYPGPLAAGPLVFANACTTAAADPLGTSELEARFFARDIRAFLGTETKVPPVFASRFAWLFFQFFLRLVDPAPIPAGEALAQARMFLWTQYRNPGGLFYCLVNRYSLYLASHDEVVSLRA